MARLTDLKAQVIGISVNDPFSNKAFAEKNRLPFPVLSDYNRETVKKYGLELADFAGLKGYTVAKRSIFILDRRAWSGTFGFQTIHQLSLTIRRFRKLWKKSCRRRLLLHKHCVEEATCHL